MYDVCIIGGGASGLMTAMLSAKQGLKVLILEKNDKIGKKLLATGNGRCNLSNTQISADCYNDDFVKHALANFDCDKARQVFFEAGMLTREEDGLIYPYSLQSATVRDVLEENLQKLGVEVRLNTKVEVVNRTEDGFLIENKYSAKYIMLACGSKVGGGIDSSPLAEKLGLKCAAQKEILCALSANGTKSLSGVRAKVVATLFEESFADGAKKRGLDNKGNMQMQISGNPSEFRQIYCEAGEVLFRDNGLSGIVIFNLSRYVCEGKRYKVSLDLMPEKDEDEVEKILFELLDKNSFSQRGTDSFEGNSEDAMRTLSGIFHKSLAKEILYRINFRQHKNIESIIYAIKNIIKNFDFIITGKNVDNAQVARGGVELSQIDAKTLESSIPNCFVGGEFLNVDGKCGGFNLHWAWASAYAVANCIADRHKANDIFY